MKSVRVTAGVLCLLLLGAAANTSAQTLSLTGNAVGNTVQLSWNAVPGATVYGVEAQVVGGPLIPLTVVGNVTSLSIPNVPNGTYNVRAWASNGAVHLASNVLTVVVGTPPPPPPPPAAPANLTAAVNGNSAFLSWSLASTSGLQNLLLQAGSTPGGADLGTFPIGVTTSAPIGTLPSGTYYARLFAVSAGGMSAPSNELTLNLPGCTAPTAIPLTTFAVGTFVSISWPQIPGALGYRLDVTTAPGAPAAFSQTFGPGQTSLTTFAPIGNHYVTLHTQLACGASGASAETLLAVDGTSGTGPRRPAGSVGLGTATAEIIAAGNAVTAQSPGDLFASCGNHNWIFKVLQRLRTIDSRYGLNWKRGVPGSMSDDVIVYNFSNLPDDQARAPQLYAWDVIGGHCGPSPHPDANSNIMNPNGLALWTILPYLQRGFAP